MNLIKELQEKKGFSDSERTIADYLLRHSRLLPSMTTRQLAKKTYTSSAAIVRFCQKLGFGGYTEFRVEFLAQMIQYIESPYGMELSMTDRDAVHSILEKVTRLEIDAMQETYRMLIDIARLLKMRGNPVLLITGKKDSTLGSLADVAFPVASVKTMEELGPRVFLMGAKYVMDVLFAVLMTRVDFHNAQEKESWLSQHFHY